MTDAIPMTALRQDAIMIATSCSANLETLKRAFDELNSSAEEQAMLVVPACKALNQAWDDLVPILNKMQALLSQRGHDRDRSEDSGLPTWSEWWASYSKRTGLNADIRTVQRKLTKYRSIAKGQTMEEKRKRDTPKVQLSPAQQAQLLTKLQCAIELADAIDAGVEYRHLLREFRAFGIDSDHIELWIENLRAGADATDSSRTPNPSAAFMPVAGPEPGHSLTILPPHPSGTAKPGDSRGLLNLVNHTCGKQISATLEGLSPEMMANVFGHFANELANTHCHYDRTAGEIIVTVKYVNAMPLLGAVA